MEHAQMVASELSQGRLADRTLSADLQQALDRHCESLVALVSSLEESGKDLSLIRALVTTMLRSYEEELIQALEGRE